MVNLIPTKSSSAITKSPFVLSSLYGAALITAGVVLNILRNGKKPSDLDITIVGVSWGVHWLIRYIERPQTNLTPPQVPPAFNVQALGMVYRYAGAKAGRAFAHSNCQIYEYCAWQEVVNKVERVRAEYFIDTLAIDVYPFNKLIPASAIPANLKPAIEEFKQTLKRAEGMTTFIEQVKLDASEGFKNVDRYIETVRAQADAILRQLPPTLQKNIPSIFGAYKWERYCGNVGEVPPMPQGIEKILTSDCPYWEGKKVYETHMLTLIPATLNGAPFTLNLLGKIIRNPQGGGHKTTCKYYIDDVKKEIGAATWSLITKGVLPDSRNKMYTDQTPLLKSHYRTPKRLELATAILMHHVETGERLYSDNPNTYSRCEEKLNNNRWQVVIGSFGASGLQFRADCFVTDLRNDRAGLAGARKF